MKQNKFKAMERGRVVNEPHFEDRTRPESDVLFEALFRPESQTYRVSQIYAQLRATKNSSVRV